MIKQILRSLLGPSILGPSIIGLSLLAAPVLADQTQSLRTALAASAKADWTAALTAAQGAAPEGADVIIWQWLRASEGKLSDYESFLARRPDGDVVPRRRVARGFAAC